MTGWNRNQVTKLETTIEQCRGEGKWQRVFELADKLKSGYPQVESLANFLMGEGKLESYLEEYPPIEDNILKARHGFTDAKRYLNSVIGESGKKGGPVAITGYVEGLSPGKHGIHIHEFGDFSRGCLSTGPHYNPYGKDHGGPDDDNRHVGDLGNIVAHITGLAKIQMVDHKITLFGEHSILGRTLSITEFEDDLGKGGHDYSKTTGNSGNRIVCAIIGVAREELFLERGHLTTRD